MKVCATTSIFAGDKNFIPILERIETINKNGIKLIRLNLKIINQANCDSIRSIVSLLNEKYPSMEILLDLPFPRKKPRVSICSIEESLRLQKNDIVFFSNCQATCDELITKNNDINCIFIKDLHNIKSIVNKNNEIFYDDGKGCFTFLDYLNENCIKASCNSKIVIYNNKSLPLPVPSVLTHEEIRLLKNLISDINPSIVAFSFVETRDDVMQLKELLSNTKAKIMCKIETQKGVDNIGSFIELIDCIMIARGDLGYGTNIGHLFDTQAALIKIAHDNKKSAYIATDFLYSLQFRVVPSRSDIIDLTVCAIQNPDGIILNASIDVEQAMKYVTTIIPNIN